MFGSARLRIPAKRFAPVHDVILYYGKSDTFTWNEPREGYDEAYLSKYYRFDDGDGRLYWRDNLTASGTRNGATGQPWRGIDPTGIGRHWVVPPDELDKLDAEGKIYWPPRGKMPQQKRYRDELKGRAVTDLWADIDRINPVGSERVGYPTQKPEALLLPPEIVAAEAVVPSGVSVSILPCKSAVGGVNAAAGGWSGGVAV